MGGENLLFPGSRGWSSDGVNYAHLCSPKPVNRDVPLLQFPKHILLPKLTLSECKYRGVAQRNCPKISRLTVSSDMTQMLIRLYSIPHFSHGCCIRIGVILTCCLHLTNISPTCQSRMSFSHYYLEKNTLSQNSLHFEL